MPALADLIQVAGGVAVIGCGNPNRGDDGAGPEVLRLLRSDAAIAGGAAPVRLLDAGTDGMAVMFAARGCEMLIIVDACRSGSESGAVFEVPGHELEQPPRSSFNLHDFRWDHALFAGRQMFREQFPEQVRVFLIEAETIGLGIGLSEKVSGAVRTVAGRIRDIVAAGPHGGESLPLSGEDGFAIRRRRIYVPRTAYDAHFAGCSGVILLRDGADLLMLPVQHAASGGYVLKIRNAAGDRVVDAGDFFRDHGCEDAWEWRGAWEWQEHAAGLRIYGVFLM